MMRRLALVTLLVIPSGLFALFTAGIVLAQAYGLAAKVNGVGISNETLERNYEEYLRENNVNVAGIRYPDRVTAMRRETVDLLINQELLWQAAQKQGIVATPEEVTRALDDMQAQFRDEDAFLSKLAIEGYTMESYRAHLKRLVSARNYLDKLSAEVAVSDAEVHAFYTENPDKFRLPEQLRARHILIKLSPGADDEAQQAARGKMAGIMTEVHNGGDFADLASQYSEDTSAAQGGDLGFFARGQMVKPFEEAAFRLQPGKLSTVVETPFGLHLIKVENRLPARTVPEDQVREQIKEYLLKVKQQQAVDNEIRNLRTVAQIEILLPL
jgi:peptidyl-prolyl cis-trans isomerase C